MAIGYMSIYVAFTEHQQETSGVSSAHNYGAEQTASNRTGAAHHGANVNSNGQHYDVIPTTNEHPTNYIYRPKGGAVQPVDNIEHAAYETG